MMKKLSYIIILFILTGCNTGGQRENSKNSMTIEKDSTQSILGKWLVVNSTILPFEHISYCEKLYLEAVFEFTADHTLNIYDSLNGKTCTENQTFKVQGNKLGIVESDMAFDYKIEKLTSDSLQLRIKRIPNYFWTEANLNDQEIKEKLEEMKENGILVTLENIKNGG